jgi:amidase
MRSNCKIAVRLCAILIFASLGVVEDAIAQPSPRSFELEYLQHIAKRSALRGAILKAMADNNIDALAYPTLLRKANLIGEAQANTNCRLAANSGLPAMVVPGGFTPDGFPIGVELLGRAWSEPQLIQFAYAYEQATHHRRPPASTPALGHR